MKKYIYAGLLLFGAILNAMDGGAESPLKQLVALRVLEDFSSEGWRSLEKMYEPRATDSGIYFVHIKSQKATAHIRGSFSWSTISPCGRFIAVSCEGTKEIEVVEAAAGTPIEKLFFARESNDRGIVGHSDWSRDSVELLMAGFDGNARIWNMKSGRVMILDESVGTTRVSWHPRRDLFALVRRLASDQFVVELWESITMRKIDSKSVNGTVVNLTWNEFGDQLKLSIMPSKDDYLGLDGVNL